MGYTDITRESVLSAIAEFEQKGRDRFLEEYDFQDARRYYLLYKGKKYPSKAIVGIAHKYSFPEIGALKPMDFSGGKDTVQKKLEELGFQVLVSDLSSTYLPAFEQGSVYQRIEIQEMLGGQRFGGISTPTNFPYILLFTGDMGLEFGYSDHKTDDGIFFYTGEGQVGDMQFIKGNAAIRDHVQNGKELLLFEYVRTGYVRYVDKMVCTGYHFEKCPDKNHVDRQAIIFELTPENQFDKSEEIVIAEKEIENLSLEKLREKALATATNTTSPKERKIIVYQRSAAIKLYALKRAHGICEGCDNPAPFKTKDGKPYLEVHHIRKVSDGGPDHPEWVVAICPNCHRQAHYARKCIQVWYGPSREGFKKKRNETLVIQGESLILQPPR